VLVATKAGFVRTGPGEWMSWGAKYLRQEVELSLRRLGVERIDLLQLTASIRTCPCRSAR